MLTWNAKYVKKQIIRGAVKVNIGIIECIINGAICITGILAFIISFFTYKKKDNVNMYFKTEESPNFIESKKIVHNLDNNLKTTITINGNAVLEDDINMAISNVINNYHHYGLLLKHNYLPKWIFCSKSDGLTSSGISIIKMYKKVLPYINERRNSNNPKYACYFEFLIKKMKHTCPQEFKSYYTTL